MRRFAEHPSETVPQASVRASERQSIYRFWVNPQVKPEQILASHRASVVERANQQTVV